MALDRVDRVVGLARQNTVSMCMRASGSNLDKLVAAKMSAIPLPTSVLFGGREFIALGGAEPSAPEASAPDRAPSGSSSFSLPSGCEIVSRDAADFEAIRLGVIAAFGWSTWTVIVRDGDGFSSFWTKNMSPAAGTLNTTGCTVELLDGGMCRLKDAGDRLLVWRPSDAAPMQLPSSAAPIQLPSSVAPIQLPSSAAPMPLPATLAAAQRLAQPAAPLCSAEGASCCSHVRTQVATLYAELQEARAEVARLRAQREKLCYAGAGVLLGLVTANLAVRIASRSK